jgi:hypothetical protein
MRKKIHLHISSEVNSVTDVWVQHLIQRIIVEQLEVPFRLQAKLLHQSLSRDKVRNDSIAKDQI